MLRGFVTTEGTAEPLSRANVVIAALGAETQTDSAGGFILGGLRQGSFELSVRLLGYLPKFVTVALPIDTTVRIQLRPIAVLDTVSITSGRSRIPGFDERRALGIGQFVTREQLARQENRKTGDILARLPGLRVYRGKGYAWIGASRGVSTFQVPPLDRSDLERGARPQCYVNVYLDGALVYSASPFAPLFDVNSISPSEIEAIEYYSGAGQIPPRYNRTNAQCGVLLIWTRR